MTVGAHPQVALEPRAAQVEIAVAQPQHLVGLDPLVDRDRRRVGCVEQLDGRGRHLDLAGRQVVVDGAVGPGAHLAVDPQHVLGADGVRVEAAGRLRVDDDLDHPGGVAQVEEHDATVVAPRRDPAAHCNRLADLRGPQVAGPMRSHHCERRPRGARAQPTDELAPVHLDLLARSEILDRHRVARLLGPAEHDAERRTRPVRDLPLGLHGPATVGAVGAQARLAQLRDQQDRGAVAHAVDHERVEAIAVVAREQALGVAGDQHPLDADAEADTRGRRTAHLLGQLVEAPAAADRVLGRVERVADELEGGARVVVEAAHEARRELVLDAELREPLLHALEVRLGLVAEVLGELRRPLDHVLPVFALRVEEPQRVLLDPLAELVAEGGGVVEQVLRQHRQVARARLRVAHRVQQQRDLLQTEIAVEPVGERDDLDVDVGVVDPEHLGAELPVLAVPALLRALVAEVRARRTRPSTAAWDGAARRRARPVRCPRAAARDAGRPCR